MQGEQGGEGEHWHRLQEGRLPRLPHPRGALLQGWHQAGPQCHNALQVKCLLVHVQRSQNNYNDVCYRTKTAVERREFGTGWKGCACSDGIMPRLVISILRNICYCDEWCYWQVSTYFDTLSHFVTPDSGARRPGSPSCALARNPTRQTTRHTMAWRSWRPAGSRSGDRLQGDQKHFAVIIYNKHCTSVNLYQTFLSQGCGTACLKAVLG